MSYQIRRRIPVDPGVRALRGLGTLMRGLGLTVHGVEEEDCTQYGSDMSATYACAQRNMAAVDASYGEGPAGSNVPPPSQYAGGTYSGSYMGPGYTPPTYALANPAAPASATPAASQFYSPSVSFVTFRGGSTLYPGDSWTITITGGPPNADVTVTGGKNGEQLTMKMGTTDSAGRFSLSGKADSSQIGQWAESWKAGAFSAGSFTFSVVAGPGGTTASQASSTSPTGGAGSSPSGLSIATAAPSIATSPHTTVVVGSTSWFSSSMIDGIPNWVLLLGIGGVAVYAMSGGHRGR